MHGVQSPLARSRRPGSVPSSGLSFSACEMGALVSPTHLTRLSCGLREVTDAEGLRELEKRGRITTGGNNPASSVETERSEFLTVTVQKAWKTPLGVVTSPLAAERRGRVPPGLPRPRSPPGFQA